jgi:hypothetical protein
MVKNPLLSLWLSAANAWAGGARSFWTSEARRQQNAMLKAVTKPGAAKPAGSAKSKASKSKSAPKSAPKAKSKSGRRTSGR